MYMCVKLYVGISIYMYMSVYIFYMNLSLSLSWSSDTTHKLVFKEILYLSWDV